MHLDTRQCAILERALTRELAVAIDRPTAASRFIDRCRAAIGIRHTDAKPSELSTIMNQVRLARTQADRYEKWLGEVLAGTGASSERELANRYGAKTFQSYYDSGYSAADAVEAERLEADFREQLAEMASA